jgi:acetyl esterase/lipase
MKLRIAIAVFLLNAWPVGAQPKVVDLWPGKPPGDVGIAGEEKFIELKQAADIKWITNVTKPSLHIYSPAKDKDTKAAVLIAPGGGYHNLAWDREGTEVADWLNSIGVIGIILKYRCPRRPGDVKGEPPLGPLLDAQRAISLVRANAKEWGIDPHRIGMIGFSAGGHLVGSTCTSFDKRAYDPIDAIDKVSCRPDFGIMAYSGYFKRKDKDDIIDSVRTPEGTPPLFFVHATDDPVSDVDHSVAFYLALKRAKLDVAMHLYPTGGHGFGVRADGPCAGWTQTCLTWLRQRSIVPDAKARRTEVAIRGDGFLINGQPTYAGRTWKGINMEGLLMNSRMVQGTFDDLNPETAGRWVYPDTKRWDPERNTREFIAAMPTWRAHGLLAVTLNLQGGSPEGYSAKQPWHNSAFRADGTLRPDFMYRLERILDAADELGMVVILGLYYFGQDERLADETAVVRGVDEAVQWLTTRGYRNVLIEINNECNVDRFDHDILKPKRVHELIDRVRQRTAGRLLVGTSYGGGAIPTENVVRSSDFLLIHGNGVSKPEQITAQIKKTRQVPGYRPMPVLYNEDDHFAFDQPRYNMLAAVEEHVSWGYFDFRMKGEGFADGYQSVPVDWSIDSARKRAFFERLREMTGVGIK